MKNIKEDIKTGNFKRVYLLYGSEVYLVRMYRDALKKAILGPGASDVNYNYFDGDRFNYIALKDAAVTLPFFAEKRLIVAEHTPVFSADCDLADFIEEMPESTVLILVEENADKRTKLYKQVAKLGYVCEFKPLEPAETVEFAAGRLGHAGKKITKSDCEYMVDSVGGDLYNIITEIDKLIDYLGSDEIVTRAAIEDICTFKIENKIFELVEAVISGDRNRAMGIYYKLIELREAPMGILRFVMRQYMKLLVIKDICSKGLSDKEVASVAHMQDWLVRKNRTLLKNISAKKLQKAIEMCEQTEVDIKNGDLQEKLAVEVLLESLLISK